MQNPPESVRLVAERLLDTPLRHPLRVGIDGPCGSGKSTLARQIVGALGAANRPAVHLDSDGFHHTRALRYRQGRDSARGYYEDAYDFEALRRRSLEPLGPGGSLQYATLVHDMDSDAVITDAVTTAARDLVVVFDCTFLQRGSLRDHWDTVIYLDVDSDVALERAVARDAARLGGPAAARQLHEGRYRAAWDIYLREERPAERADVVLDYNDPSSARILRG